MSRMKRACGPPLFLLTCGSILASSLAFIFSMLHLGFDSFFTIPIVYSITIVYHATILTMEYRNSTRMDAAAPSTSLASVVCAAVVTALWLGAFTVILLVAVLLGAKALVAERQTLWLLIAQSLLSFTEAMVMLAIVARTSYERQQGTSSVNWRRTEDIY